MAASLPPSPLHSSPRLPLSLSLHRAMPRYILFDEAGEMHPPKTQTQDGGRAEVGLSPLLEQHMREQVLRDLELMGDRGEPLAPGFLRQLGRVADANILQASLLNEVSATATATTSSASGKKRRLKGAFDIDCILEARAGTRTTEPSFLVRWTHENYHPSWETYRTEGEGVGQPMATWEPISGLLMTEAFAVWREVHPPHAI